MTRVINLKNTKDYTVYIGRPGYFGNPFLVGKDGDRKEVLLKYKEYFYSRLKTDPEFLKRIKELKGKILGCFCKPLLCHGDIIVEFLEGVKVNLEEKENPFF